MNIVLYVMFADLAILNRGAAMSATTAGADAFEDFIDSGILPHIHKKSSYHHNHDKRG